MVEAVVMSVDVWRGQPPATSKCNSSLQRRKQCSFPPSPPARTRRSWVLRLRCILRGIPRWSHQAGSDPPPFYPSACDHL